MAHIEFGTRERSLLLALMALGGSASNPELREQFGDVLDGVPRRRMNDAGLVDSSRPARAFHHELTEAGWAWCVEELSATPPARSGSLGRALYCVLPMIRSYLDHADVSLADFVTRRAVPATDAHADLETRIREAYWSVADKPQDWVLLTEVRPLLGDAARAEVDSVLRQLERLPGVHLAPEADQKTLTGADRDAAVRIGGADQHLLSIEAR
ncbi:MAG: hypothetical protein ABIS86_18695 [Streptosporangiaceae bacterium]